MQSSNDMIRAGLKDAVDKAFKANGTGELAPPAEKRQIAVDIVNEAAPIILNQTNNEPWYQSRVTWGAIISAAVPIGGAVGIQLDWIEPDELAILLATAGSVVGSALTIYGRWKAKKPIGS